MDFRRDLLETIGEPEALATTDKIYHAHHRVIVRDGFFAGAYKVDRLRGQLPVTLFTTLTTRGPTVDVPASQPASQFA